MNTFAKNLEMRGNVTSGMDRILDVPRCAVQLLTTQSIGASTITPISFDNAPAALDTDGMFSVANLDRVTIRTAGRYAVSAHVLWDLSAGGTVRGSWLRINGAGLRYAIDFRAPSAAFAVTCSSCTPLSFNASDYVELYAFQDTVGALSTSTNGATSASAQMNLCLIST